MKTRIEFMLRCILCVPKLQRVCLQNSRRHLYTNQISAINKFGAGQNSRITKEHREYAKNEDKYERHTGNRNRPTVYITTDKCFAFLYLSTCANP